MLSKKHSLVFMLFFLCAFTYGQTVSEILRSSERIRSKHKLFIRFDGSKLLIDNGSIPEDFITFIDSSLYLPDNSRINIYMRPMNPLKFTYEKDIQFIADPIDEAYQKALEALGSSVVRAVPEGAFELLKFGLPLADPGGCGEDLVKLIDDHSSTIKSLDSKSQTKSLFEKLLDLDFEDQNETGEDIVSIREQFDKEYKKFTDWQKEVESREGQIQSLDCKAGTNQFVTKTAIYYQIEKLKEVLDIHISRWKNLEKALTLVEEAYKDAKKSKDGIEWILHVAEVEVKKGEITNFNIVIKSSGFQLSEDNEIAKVEPTENLSNTIRFREFQRLIPEIRSGIAYSDFRFLTYSTGSNDLGETVVAEGKKEAFRRMTFNAMINFTLYSTKSPILPFFQIGAGANSSFPTLFSGIGLVTNKKGRISLSGGLAYTWSEELTDLSVGEVVQDQSTIDNDVSYKFETPRPYFGIQIKF